MRGVLGLFVVITTIWSAICEVTDEVNKVKRSSKMSRVLLVTLGGSEEELMMTMISSLLISRDYDVTVFTYGGGGGGVDYPEGVEIIQITPDDDDDLYSVDGQNRCIVPSDSEPNFYDVINPTNLSANRKAAFTYDEIVTSSRRLACKQLLDLKWRQDQISRAKIFITPLHYQDLCTLTFARQFDLPIVGVVTSRYGAWWAWLQLDTAPSLAKSSVAFGEEMAAGFGFWERAKNVWRCFSYISTMERNWLNPLMTSQPSGTFQPIETLYNNITSVLVAWDWLTDPDLPMTSYLTSTAGSRWDSSQELSEHKLGGSLRLRNGAIFVNLKLKELWVGMAAQQAILRALTTTPFTVVWRGVEDAWEGVEGVNKTGDSSKAPGVLIYQEDPPMGALLAHPRHKLLISMCGESEVIAAILFGSPVLCVPVSPDQIITSRKLKELGLGLVLPASDVTTNGVKDIIRELISNKSYRSRGRQLAEEYIDQPLSASDRVLHALEKLVRRPWRYKRRQQQRLSLFASSNGDVMAAILILVTSLLGVAIWVIIVIVRDYMRREPAKRKGE